MNHSIFIDGQAGTTGLEIYQQLEKRTSIRLLEIEPSLRKDKRAKRDMYESADVVVLCLPDAAAKEAAELSALTRILDASTAHRTNPNWTYGLPELCTQQRDRIAQADQVSNPGCYPTGFILLMYPLIQTGLLDPATRIKVHALSGYSGGGKSLIARYESGEAAGYEASPYALELAHKHLPEMQKYTGLTHPPLFEPMVGSFFKGMLVQVPLFVSEFQRKITPTNLLAIYSEQYANEKFIQICDFPPNNYLEAGFLSPQGANGTNRVDIFVFGRADQIVLTARLDNLGKGASSAAVQNLNIMLNIEESEGLVA